MWLVPCKISLTESTCHSLQLAHCHLSLWVGFAHLNVVVPNSLMCPQAGHLIFIELEGLVFGPVDRIEGQVCFIDGLPELR